MAEKIDYSKGIYDAKQLGTPKLLILGAQHMFAMFGATVLVPLLTGLSVSTTLLCAGLGTLLFHFLCKGKVPAFLGSSFAYLGGFTIVTNGGANPENLPYACAAVALSGLNIGVFPIGDLIMSIINFLCISLVVFWMVKIINRFNRKKEKEPEPEAPAKPTTDELLADILAELKLQNGRAEAAKTLDAAEEEESSASER